MSDTTWTVLRRYRGKQRCAYIGNDEAKARRVFSKARSKLRQGGVRLIGPGGNVVESAEAYDNRSRW